MARDLSFWKYKKGVEENDDEVYERLSSGDFLENVELLPTKNIIKDINKNFNEWNWIDENHLEFANQVIELFITDQFVRFDCYNVTYEIMNLIIDIMAKYECPLYDSTISVRFEL